MHPTAKVFLWTRRDVERLVSFLGMPTLERRLLERAKQTTTTPSVESAEDRGGEP